MITKGTQNNIPPITSDKQKCIREETNGIRQLAQKGAQERTNYRRGITILFFQCGEMPCCLFDVDKEFDAKINNDSAQRYCQFELW